MVLPTTPTAIDTRTVKSRRQLFFLTLDAALDEAGALTLADRHQRLSPLGNWTLGQALNHLATWMDFPFVGYPPAMNAPLPIRVIARMLKKRILRKGMPVGMKLRGVPGGTYGNEPASLDEGLAHFQRSTQRLKSSAPMGPNPLLGALTHQQWIDLNLRHAELHLSFFTLK